MNWQESCPCCDCRMHSLEDRQAATGDFDGNINLWDVENKQSGTSYIQNQFEMSLDIVR